MTKEDIKSMLEKKVLIRKTAIPFIHKEIILPKKETYIYEDFIFLPKEDFLKKAYNVFLRREPDKEGYNYYMELLNRGVTKSEVLTYIYFSPESKKNPKLLGAKKRFWLYRFFKLPFIRYLYFLYKLPKILPAVEDNISYLNKNLIKAEEINGRIEKINEVNLLFAEKSIECGNNIMKIQQEIDKVKENIKNQYYNMKNLTEKIQKEIESLKPPKNIPFFYEEKADFKITQKDEYLALEEIFYPEVLVKEKQKIYLRYVKNRKKWLDVGCGRGEFLSILKNAGIDAVGIDINKASVKKCEKIAKAYEKDVNAYLKETKEKFDGISALQVVEHLNYEYLKEFLSLAYEKLKEGGVIILETPNPKNIEVLKNFYIDPTHKKPVPPELLAFLVKFAGFEDVKIVYSQPTNPNSPNLEENYNDYAVIGIKK
ncbi:methyltransferase domain-containing protein [Caminibacter sp.]